ncbi:GNAT family N-acetyltransferase [Paenibacillus allorhizosphaerae]|uniref:N-acetyltransferase domain-containing protein n=1 Tax=Paenibacillus allorhizosphaerae TaxID=2849866 RepID=A0ABN7TN67_9BACL|nr:GNAT family N-acetyltransferase [Paenibacillus allorhizosphaerae]CAG7642394.1 hypothetical protein PAECIP111802_02853 [Paenibacillus allorhizosphaerae]
MEFCIRQAECNELNVVHETMREAFKEYAGKLQPESGALRETMEDIERKISGGGGAIIAWNNNEPAGSAQYYFKDGYMYIGRVAVIPQYRGSGLGKRLIHYLEAEARRRSCRETRLEVRLSVPENMKFYERLHYETLEQQYYPGGTDSWYVMSKDMRA